MHEIINFVKTLYHKLHSLIILEEKDTSTYSINFVLGNSTCDLDSFLSAITLSYFRNIKSGFISVTKNNEITYNVKKHSLNNVYIPIINCKKEELLWRLDISELLSKLEIKPDELFYYKDALLFNSNKVQFKPVSDYIKDKHKTNSSLVNTLLDRVSCQFILVDHHELDPSQKELIPFVEEILDHHDDKDFDYKLYPNLTTKLVEFPRISNMILILEEFLTDDKLKACHESLFKNNFFDILVAAPIIDSNNFDDKLKNSKWIDKDKVLVSNIVSILKTSIFSSPIERIKFSEDADYQHFERLFKILSNVKFDCEKNLNIGIEGLINKDLKRFEIELKSKEDILYITYASFPVPLKKVISKYSKENFFKFLESFSIDKAYNRTDFYVIIYIQEDKKLCAFLYVTEVGLKNHNGLLKEENIKLMYKHLLDVFVLNDIMKVLPDLELKSNAEENSNAYLMYTTGKLNRKTLWPNMKDFFTGKKH